jgi:type VI secretion system protein ImpB
MAGKEGSVAPRERVNIVYKPATGGAQEEKELPLKLLVMGDFTGRTDDRALEDRKPVNVDKDNFNDVMKSMKLGASFQADDKLSAKEGGELAVNLKFAGLKDMEPEAVARQVPELQKLIDLRDALAALKGPLGNVPEFRKKIEALVKDPAAREKLMKELGGGDEKK